MVSSHKFYKVIYSKFFGFSFFKAKLTSIIVLVRLNILSGVYCFIVSLPMIVVGSMGAYYNVEFDQVAVACIDVIILTTVMILFLVCET